jgi:hypothetical protein
MRVDPCVKIKDVDADALRIPVSGMIPKTGPGMPEKNRVNSSGPG